MTSTPPPPPAMTSTPQGADINAQTEETQETALTLACCGGFLEVADFLIKVKFITTLVSLLSHAL